MTVYKDHVTFSILGEEIYLISDETVYGRNTVVEIQNCYHYLGHIIPDITAAIAIWQKVNGRNLNEKEIDQVLLDNNYISSTI